MVKGLPSQQAGEGNSAALESNLTVSPLTLLSSSSNHTRYQYKEVGAGDITQQHSNCPASTRSWVWVLVQNKTSKQKIAVVNVKKLKLGKEVCVFPICFQDKKKILHKVFFVSTLECRKQRSRDVSTFFLYRATNSTRHIYYYVYYMYVWYLIYIYIRIAIFKKTITWH